jgi:predicted transcriptional regulator
MSTYVIHPVGDHEKIVKAFLEALEISFEKEDETLPAHVLEGIARGQADIAAGNFITHEEFIQRIAARK